MRLGLPICLAHDKFAAASREIRAAVKEGKLSQEEAREKLAALKKQMSGNSGKDKTESDAGLRKRELEIRERRLRAAVEEIEAAVKAGKLSKDEAQEKLIGIPQDVGMYSDPRSVSAFGI